MSRSNQLAGLITATPSAALDTINEINTSLNNDAALYTTLTNSIATKAPKASPVFTGTVSGVTKAHVGLGNVDNESKSTMFASPTFTGTITAPNNSISGSAVADETILIEFILIGGGGPGGTDRGGGGGAGGYIRTSAVVQKGVAYTIDIGAGGAGRGGTQAPVNGENSTAFGYIAIGGGCGGTYHSNNSDSMKGQDGGSGGGTTNYNEGIAGGGVAGQGNSGGAFMSMSNTSAGGGGGAGGHGQPATSKGGDGGIGVADDWEGSTIYRAGGGGGASSSGSAGTGKSGGGNGSTGDNSSYANDASHNSGSGGGGATGGGSAFGGDGGSGICLVRNLTSLGTATITGANNTTSTRNFNSVSYKVYKFVADGTITF